MTANYRMADITFSVTSVYESVHRYCSDYRTDAPAEFEIVIGRGDIEAERIHNERTAKAEGRTPIDAPPDYLEALAVYRKFCTLSVDRDVMLFHGSAVAVDGEAYLFTAPSGTGKSTHTRLWREYLSDRAVMVNDDKPLIRLPEQGTPLIYGTPYNGKHRLGCNMSAPLKAVCVLTRSAENRIRPVKKSEIYHILLQQTFRPADPVQLAKTLTLIDRLAAGTKLYLLGCNMDISAAETAYNTMRGE
ncbi:hypothetical protein SAMN02910447_01530 [Ruminococcus sp. YE71]|uniref:hypothetical protein n=1 Tax=unclassified Ruminococcus TaxID=2608920 RepID=UPI0008811DA7|nr:MULTISPECIES: hypothetical protein [unclassified Ruminococcus]SDA18476.1 hypothetical protein SAMN02910446_01442 [Ruminococcus sp. YE78]SFW29861.1 hypothetical protein SAMN02910447_01530 [Ruminococcus sp. YE71]